MIYIGCDPGTSGAVAVIDDNREVLLCEDFPVIKTSKAPRKRTTTDKKTGKKVTKTVKGTKTEIDFVGLSDLFDRIVGISKHCIAMVEQVSSRPTDSVTSAFSFGGAYASLFMALADRSITTERVTPQRWQKLLLQGIHYDKKTIKDAYLGKARSMFPKVDLSRKKDAERAAALLIAEFGRRAFKGETV